MILGIVGSEEAKFTEEGRRACGILIYDLLTNPGVTGISSGHCHLGGVDIWAEHEAKRLNKDLFIYPPNNLSWETGYKPRNIKIAEKSDIVYCITVNRLPDDYKGMRFALCYHHRGEKDVEPHIKSGGCWTMNYARKLGKQGILKVINQ